MKKRNVFLIIILAAVLFLAAFGLLRIRNGHTVKPENSFSIEDEVVRYRQDDERWADEKLGTSEYTMKSSGCLVTCISSALSMERAEEVTPGELNRQFSEADVYDTDGNLLWEQLRETGEYEADVCQDVSAEIIEDYLREGKYPIARVRMNGIGNYHYVLIVGADENSFLCMDPLRDEITPLSHYLNRVYALRCVYGAEMPEEHLQEEEMELEGGIRTWISGQAEAQNAEYQNASGFEWSQSAVFGNEGRAAAYESRQALLADWSFAEEEPFYQYFDQEGKLLLELYLNEETMNGCGIRYFAGSSAEAEEQLQEMQAFTIDGAIVDTWMAEDAFSVKSYDGNDGKESVSDYGEHYEYTEDGRLSSYRSWGTIDWLGDPEEENVMDILEIEYSYREDGTLEHRSYAHNSFLFGTSFCTMDSDYDEMERLVYETSYITHGTYEKYFIYKDNGDEPAYSLELDNNLGYSIPVLIKYE